MATINEVVKNFDILNFQQVVIDTLYQSEKDILFLNANQMQDGKGKDGANLKHTNKKYTGVYKSLTAEIANTENTILPKRAGELYNFGWTGDFLNNLDLKLTNNEISIFSTGTGTGDKKLFFDGFKTLFGLNSDSRSILINEKGLQNKLVKNVKSVVRL